MAFRGRVALVTGGGSGMGQLACQRLAKAGAKVAALDVNAEGLEATVAYAPGVIEPFVCDVTDVDAVDKVVAQVAEKLGPVDRTVAAAAIMPTGLAAEMDVQRFHQVMDVNYGGVVNVVRATLPGMLERGSGDQVIFSSLMGFLPTMYLAAYCASKFAVRAFAEILYHENRDSGVRFACVAPPTVDTPLLDQISSPLKVMKSDKAPTPLAPVEVLEAIEEGLEAGRFWITPGQARSAIRASRFIPELVWKNIHRMEGLG